MAVPFPVASVLKTALHPSNHGARVLVLIACRRFLTDRRADPRESALAPRARAFRPRASRRVPRARVHPPAVRRDKPGGRWARMNVSVHEPGMGCLFVSRAVAG